MARTLGTGLYPRLWNRSIARARLMGPERTMNPSPAAAALLGMTVRRPTMHNQGVARRRLQKRTRTGNPVPAALAVLSAAQKLAGRFRKPSERVFGGPLGGTVNAFQAQAEAGQKGWIPIVRNAMRSAKDKDAWQRIWAELVPSWAMPKSLRTYIQQSIDPTFPSAEEVTVEHELEDHGGKTKRDQDDVPTPTRTKAAPRAPREPRAPRVKKVSRYNPDTGRKVMVPEDSDEAAMWPSRKPSMAAKKKTNRMVGTMTTKILTAAVSGGIVLTKAAAASYAAMASAAGLSVAAASALVVGAGLASFAATTWVMRQIANAKERATPAYRREQIALGYRRARLSFQERVGGRALTPTEHKVLADKFKRDLATEGVQ